MKKLIHFLLCLLTASMLMFVGCSRPNETITVVLIGEVIDRPESTYLVLWREWDCSYFDGITIPIIDGRFEYVLNAEFMALYNLLFFDATMFSPASFFPERDTIRFTLHSEDRSDENIVDAGEYTRLFLDHSGSLENIWETFDLKIQQMESDNIAFDMDEIEGLRQLERTRVSLQFIKENPNIVGYLILLGQIGFIAQGNVFDCPNFDLLDISPYIELYQTIFKPMFPNHPYTEEIERMLAPPKIIVGEPFIDFSAPDFDGNMVTLSEQIAGKTAVLFLWASWCGPCIRKGVELMPLYQEFRDKGFVVIGVARETAVANAKAVVERHGFPWINLVDLVDAQGIWEKYDILNFAGAEFLIDENGIVIAKSPSIEEIREFLNR